MVGWVGKDNKRRKNESRQEQETNCSIGKSM